MEQTKISDERKVELLEALDRFPKSLWPKIFWSISPDSWPEELGEKTEDFWEEGNFICEFIHERIGSKAIMRYANVSSGNMTDQMFDDFWDSMKVNSEDDLHSQRSNNSDKCANKSDCPVVKLLSTLIGTIFVFLLASFLLLLIKLF